MKGPWLPLSYTQTLSLKQLLVHENRCRIEALHSATLVRKAGSSEAGTSNVPWHFPAVLKMAGCRGWHSQQSHNSPVVSPTQLPPDGFPLIATMWLEKQQGSGNTSCSPGEPAPATCKHRVTQPPPPPPPHTSPFLKHCLSSVGFMSHFPYHT